MHDQRPRHARRVAAFLAVVALVAAACGDDAGDTDERGDSTTTTGVVVDEPGPDDDAGSDDPGPATPDEPVALTATDTGVTESVIRLGAVFPDTSLLGRDPGDVEAKFRTIADAINETGGINGRTIELTFRSVNPIDDAAFDATCVELTEDVGVFAAIGLFPRSSADCYAQLNDTIVISTFAITPEQMAGYTAPGITTNAHPARLVEQRIAALVEGGVLADGMAVAVVGGAAGVPQHEQYIAALESAGLDVVADSIVTGDGQDLLALTQEMSRFTEVWKSSGAEVVVASAALLSQALVIGYNEGNIELPIVLPEGTGVAPSLLQDQQGLDLAPLALATALVGGDDQPTKYETGADGVRECVDAFEAASDEDVALDESRNNLAPTIVACQVFDVFVQVADAVGPALTTEAFAAAVEAFGSIEVTDLVAASLGPGKWDLDDTVGVIAEFDADAVQFQPVG
jgi:branched-chain amino acid transport system substrate-binding protein